MAPPAWILSIPIGFGSTFSLRLISLFLQMKSGVPLKNAQGREQPLSKEVALKDRGGYARRAFLAHCNSWEAMILWTSSVVVAKIIGVEKSTMNSAAVVWMGARFMYAPAYILIKDDKASYLRSALFMVGTASAFRLMIAAVKKLEAGTVTVPNTRHDGFRARRARIHLAEEERFSMAEQLPRGSLKCSSPLFFHICLTTLISRFDYPSISFRPFISAQS